MQNRIDFCIVKYYNEGVLKIQKFIRWRGGKMVTTAKDAFALKVVKRDGKKTAFNEEKIALAIKKGFDSVTNEEYTEEDTNKVFVAVLDAIKKGYQGIDLIKIEDIQDLIEKKLQDLKYKLIDLDIETKSLKSYFAEWSLQWLEAIISLRVSEIKKTTKE